MTNDTVKMLDAYVERVGIKRLRCSDWSRVGAVSGEQGTIEYYVATFGYSFIYVDVVNGAALGHMVD